MDRVTSAAKAYGGETYEGYPNHEGLEGELRDSAYAADDYQWMTDRMSEGRTISDIGPDPRNAFYPGVTSDAYSIERYAIDEAKYLNRTLVPFR